MESVSSRRAGSIREANGWERTNQKDNRILKKWYRWFPEGILLSYRLFGIIQILRYKLFLYSRSFYLTLILNIIYLLHEGLLNYPVLYLSIYININKGLYYRYLQNVRDSGSAEQWEKYILFMLEGVIRTSRLTSDIVTTLRDMMVKYKHQIRDNHPSFYSQDLINVLFSYPYTRIGILKNTLGVSYLTARKYLDVLTEDKLLEKIRLGRDSYYVNTSMIKVLTDSDADTLRIDERSL